MVDSKRVTRFRMASFFCSAELSLPFAVLSASLSSFNSDDDAPPLSDLRVRRMRSVSRSLGMPRPL